MTGMMIAGAASGVGKTTVTLALIAAMRRRGMTVQPFKGGPDFLDGGHHTRIAGRRARNVDTWMLSHEANVELVSRAASGADAILVEGMMGLFDGRDGGSETGSSAEIAKLLKLPVILVLDAGMSARSIAAVVLGFELFDPGLKLAGVILNRVAGEHHYRLLESAIASRCSTKIIGWLPSEPAIRIAERHLGLMTAEESIDTQEQVEQLADIAERQFDMDGILALRCGLELSHTKVAQASICIRIGVARDRAFSFYYEDNLDLLRANGAEMIEFSPLADEALPDDLDALYLGGGYPELYADQLSGNSRMTASIRRFAATGRPIYAECGGMIYLSRSLSVKDAEYAMLDVLPFAFEMTDRLVNFGYATVLFTRDCLPGPAGTVVRGHSFHHSRMLGEPEPDTCYQVEYSLSGQTEQEGFSRGNILASYIHLHFATLPEIARHFVAAALEQRAAIEVPA